MAEMIPLTNAVTKDGKVVGASPVWLNPHGINSVETSDHGTWIHTDDGRGYLVVEGPEYVVDLVNLALGEYANG